MYKTVKDGKLIDIDSPKELVERVQNALEYYHYQMAVAKQIARQKKDIVIKQTRNEWKEENASLRRQLGLSVVSLSSDKELNAYKIFCSKHMACRKTKIDGGKVPYIVQNHTGVGTITHVCCQVCGASEDITDTSVW
jgi:hypothetical protein